MSTDEPNPWNQGFPKVTERGRNQIKFELQIGDTIRNAYNFSDEGEVWKDADNFQIIPRDVVTGWREPTPKTCRFGNHPIDEVTARGCITYYVVKDGKTESETYACRDCDQHERIREYASTGIVRMKLWMDASMRQHDREFVLRAINAGWVERLQQIIDYSKHVADTLFKEEQAYNADRAEQYREDIECLLTNRPSQKLAIGAGLLPPDPFKGDPGVACILALFGDEERLFWFDRLCAEMESVTRIAKEWERAVWFGGEDRSQDPQYTRAYAPDIMEDSRAYIDKKTCLVPGSLQAFVIPAEYQGYSATVGDRTYLSYSMCGRSIFQIDDKPSGHSVSIILDEDSPQARGGIRNIHARKEEAIGFIQQAIDDWKAGKIDLVHGDGVGFGF